MSRGVGSASVNLGNTGGVGPLSEHSFGEAGTGAQTQENGYLLGYPWVCRVLPWAFLLIHGLKIVAIVWSCLTRLSLAIHAFLFDENFSFQKILKKNKTGD